jgi:hypothetical protein
MQNKLQQKTCNFNPALSQWTHMCSLRNYIFQIQYKTVQNKGRSETLQINSNRCRHAYFTPSLFSMTTKSSQWTLPTGFKVLTKSRLRFVTETVTHYIMLLPVTTHYIKLNCLSTLQIVASSLLCARAQLCMYHKGVQCLETWRLTPKLYNTWLSFCW